MKRMKRAWKSTSRRTIAVAVAAVMLTGCANLALLQGNTGESNAMGSAVESHLTRVTVTLRTPLTGIGAGAIAMVIF